MCGLVALWVTELGWFVFYGFVPWFTDWMGLKYITFSAYSVSFQSILRM